MDARYYTLTLKIRTDEAAPPRGPDDRVVRVRVEAHYSDPTSHAEVAALHGHASFDLSALLAKQARHDDYGRELTEQLFSDAGIKQRFLFAETAAHVTSSSLRLLLAIDGLPELQSLRWELLRHPLTDAALATSPSLLLSRLMVSHDLRPVRLRAGTGLSVLVAISAPTPEKLPAGLHPVEFEIERRGVTEAFAGLEVRTLGRPGEPVTLDRLCDGLARADILYLVCHGVGGRTGKQALMLQDDAGDPKYVEAQQLSDRLRDLERDPTSGRPGLPRLVVLASCQSAGDGEQAGAAVRATLASRFADAGVPAVLAMQGFITMETVEAMMPVFFAELLRDGQIDRALAVARGKVRDRPDAWMPALHMRLLSGQLWYRAGFVSAKGDGQDVWQLLRTPLFEGNVVPILGPRLLEDAFGDSSKTARGWADAILLPFAEHERDNLPRVIQYLSVKDSREGAITKYQEQLLHNLIAKHDWLQDTLPRAEQTLSKVLELVGERLRTQHSADPFRILAEIPASVYVTTNFDPLLQHALRARDRKPQTVRTRWRYQENPQSADEQPILAPSDKQPLVYHAFGTFSKTDDGMVLTEDDYFDYLIGTSAYKLTPPEVESALVGRSLLFLGFRLSDWHFRLLFRLMMNLPGVGPERRRIKRRCHVAVQVDPDLQTMKDVEAVKQHFDKYFLGEANITVYWGSIKDFLSDLRDKLDAGPGLARNAKPKRNDDDWNF